MAEAIGLAASILQVAVFGASVVTTLRTLSSSYTSADQKVKDLSSDISLTASILTSLGNTIQDYQYDLHFKEDQFLPAKEACERNFQRLRKALKEAKRGEDGKWKPKSLTAWDKLMFALGGEDEIKGLVVSIETSKSTLQLLLDSVNLLVLKRLSKKHLLDEDQAEDLKLLVWHLPSLLKSLQAAGLAGAGPPKPVFNPRESTTVFTHMNNETSQLPEVSHRDLPVKEPSINTIAPADPVASAYGADKEVVPDWLKSVSEVPREAQQGFEAKRSEESKADKQFQVLDSDGKKNEKANLLGSKDKDDDTRSSHSSIKDRYLYEGWLLENRRQTPGPTIISFCGLKIKVHQDPNTWDNDYYLSPRTLDSDYLKLLVKKSEPKSTDPRVTFLESLDCDAQEEIRILIQDRNDVTTGPNSWVLAAIVDVARQNRGSVKKALFWTRKKEKGDQDPRWMIVLKGGLHDLVPKQPVVPDRDHDPWALNENTDALKMANSEASQTPTGLGQAAKAMKPLTDSKKEAIRFKDVVGRKFCFPFELACTWPGIEELIRTAFLHVEALGPHVADGHYDLIGPTGEIILPQIWETVVEPGWAVAMQMWPMPKPRPLDGGSITNYHHPPPLPPPGQIPPSPLPPQGRRGHPPPGDNPRPSPRSKHAPRPNRRRKSTSSTRRSSSPDGHRARLEDDLRRSSLSEKKMAEVAQNATSEKRKDGSIADSSLVRDSPTRVTERVIVEARREGIQASSDVVAIEDESPQKDYQERHELGGYLTLDPSSYGGPVDGNRGRRFNPKPKPLSSRSSSASGRSLRSVHWEELSNQEQAEANRAVDEFISTLIDDVYVSEAGSSSSGSWPDD